MVLVTAIFTSCKDDDCDCTTDVINNANTELSNYELSYVEQGEYKGFFALSNNNDDIAGVYFVCNPEKIKNIGFNNNSTPIHINAIGNVHKARYNIPTTGVYWEIEILSITK